MSHVPPAPAATPAVEQAQSAVCTAQHGRAGIVVSEQEVVFSTAAAISVQATTRRRRLATTLTATIGRIHLALPEPRPIYPRRGCNYVEAARMSREMGHL
jgi:hypothetical protein